MTNEAEARPRRLLLVEDDAAFLRRLSKNLEASGFEIVAVSSVEEARERLSEQPFDLILTDIRLPGASGLDLLGELRRAAGPDSSDDAAPPPVVVLTSINTVDTAVEAMRRGAADYLTKEATRDEIVLRLRNILGRSELADENRRLRSRLDRYDEFNEIVGVSGAAQQLKKKIAEAASSDIGVLIEGPTGVGKELVARALHRASARAKGPFVEVNCAALPDENLFLSELFGHEKGAFTGALNRKLGRFELADGGTLFLDEIGELGALAQARLLKAVETLEFHRLGGERSIRANCRLLFATNRNLMHEVKEGRFREDLFYRINIYPIEVPALRARLEDVPPLARFFAARFAEKHGLEAPTFTDEALAILRNNPWPGNIRELRNVVERLAIRFRGKAIAPADLAELNLGVAPPASGAVMLPEGGIDLEEVERNLVVQALQRADWNQRQAAELLGISVDRINARVKKFNLKHPSWRVHKD